MTKSKNIFWLYLGWFHVAYMVFLSVVEKNNDAAYLGSFICFSVHAILDAIDRRHD